MGKYDAELEQDRKEIEGREQIFHRSYARYREIIEHCLQEERYSDIAALFDQKDVLDLAQIDTGFAILNIIVNIYRMELNEQTEHNIWDHVHSMDELIRVYLRLKMYLWRLEFTEDQNSFINYVMEQEISVPCVKWLIHTSAFQKTDTIYKIALLYKEHRAYASAFGMLYYLNELSSEKELIYCEMADLYIQLQQYQAAADCLEKIRHPSELLKKYKQKWGLLDE